jgi:hypothetical protein
LAASLAVEPAVVQSGQPPDWQYCQLAVTDLRERGLEENLIQLELALQAVDRQKQKRATY